MALTVLSVGLRFPGGFTEFVPLNAKRSLLDADLILFRPGIGPFFDLEYPNSHYRGKPCLTDDASFALKEAASYWRQQISLALQAGKNVFVYLPPFEEVFVDTGQRTYSGTGRNRQTTRHVDLFDNYRMLPTFAEQTVPSEGAEMRLSDKGQIVGDYWREFGAQSRYHVLFQGLKVSTLITTADGGLPVACRFTLSGAKGQVLALPPPATHDFDPSDSTGAGGEWSKETKAFGQQLLNALLALDRTIRKVGERTPAPEWANRDVFLLRQEREVQQQILAVDSEVETLIANKAELAKLLEDEGSLRGLLYESGAALERAIRQALQVLGFRTEPFRSGESEFDAVFVGPEGRFIGEAEGKDNRQVNIDKLRQLEMNIQEDFARDNVTEYARAVLFGNAFRLQPPEDREPQWFTDKCMTAAVRSATALVRTIDLFHAAKAVKESGDAAYAALCRRALLEQGGKVVEFPKPGAEQEATLHGLQPTAVSDDEPPRS